MNLVWVRSAATGDAATMRDVADETSPCWAVRAMLMRHHGMASVALVCTGHVDSI